ncbi:MAG: hypothetical protein ABSD30_14575 [Candidatus Binatus sp.]|jgi:hypothetical protein
MRVSILGLVAVLVVSGCLYPPEAQPPPDEKQQVVIPLPYDLAWDAVNSVITQNSFRVQAQDMTNGIIEAAGPRFTLQDADCGKIKSVVGAYTAEPELNSSSVYNFLVRPRGPEASLVEVRATFNSPVKVPLHQSTDVDCVSHGIQESNLLREVLVEAKQTHRPEYAKPAGSPPGASTNTAESATPGRRAPSSIDKAPATRAPARGFSLTGPMTLPDLPAPPQ